MSSCTGQTEKLKYKDNHYLKLTRAYPGNFERPFCSLVVLRFAFIESDRREQKSSLTIAGYLGNQICSSHFHLPLIVHISSLPMLNRDISDPSSTCFSPTSSLDYRDGSQGQTSAGCGNTHTHTHRTHTQTYSGGTKKALKWATNLHHTIRKQCRLWMKGS